MGNQRALDVQPKMFNPLQQSENKDAVIDFNAIQRVKCHKRCTFYHLTVCQEFKKAAQTGRSLSRSSCATICTGSKVNSSCVAEKNVI